MIISFFLSSCRSVGDLVKTDIWWVLSEFQVKQILAQQVRLDKPIIGLAQIIGFDLSIYKYR